MIIIMLYTQINIKKDRPLNKQPFWMLNHFERPLRSTLHDSAINMQTDGQTSDRIIDSVHHHHVCPLWMPKATLYAPKISPHPGAQLILPSMEKGLWASPSTALKTPVFGFRLPPTQNPGSATISDARWSTVVNKIPLYHYGGAEYRSHKSRQADRCYQTYYLPSFVVDDKVLTRKWLQQSPLNISGQLLLWLQGQSNLPMRRLSI